ncbi:18.1 kDa class I heat shock protein [Platanthera guangdongensis]|uniref:18.1 kDa class I heat shock protein n=1 Tax=Platanthera guangdongensis TaxID=2320717 RepID=A0ABR2M8Y7_9ASPA
MDFRLISSIIACTCFGTHVLEDKDTSVEKAGCYLKVAEVKAETSVIEPSNLYQYIESFENCSYLFGSGSQKKYKNKFSCLFFLSTVLAGLACEKIRALRNLRRELVEIDNHWHCVERINGKFLRQFLLSENAKVDRVAASMDNVDILLDWVACKLFQFAHPKQ